MFDQGCIVEDGSHAELLAHGGAYQRLWSRQAGGFLLDGGAGESAEAGEELLEGIPLEADSPEEIIGHDRTRSKAI